MGEDAPLAVEAAWALLLSAAGAARQADGAVEVAGAAGSNGLRLARDGSWTASPAPTSQAHDLLELFAPLVARGAFVLGQLGQSLDGRIATVSGHSHYINGPEDIRRLHRCRALVDAVVVGAGTAVADDPRLTVREVEGPNPGRVVLDPRGRIPAHLRLFDATEPVVWCVGPRAEVTPPPGVWVEVLPVDEGGAFEPADVVARLASRGWRRLLIEGGGLTVSRFLEANALDRLHVSVAPLILGSGRPAFTLPEIETLDEARRPVARHFRLGTDLLFDLDLAD